MEGSPPIVAEVAPGANDSSGQDARLGLLEAVSIGRPGVEQPFPEGDQLEVGRDPRVVRKPGPEPRLDGWIGEENLLGLEDIRRQVITKIDGQRLGRADGMVGQDEVDGHVSSRRAAKGHPT